MLPKTFVSDFGASLGDYATFIDPNNNQFEVMVERIRGSVFLTIGFNAIHDFYVVRVWCLQCNWWSSVFRVYEDGSILMFLNYLFILMKFMLLSFKFNVLSFWNSMQFMVLKCFFVWLLILNAIYGWLFTTNLYCTLVIHGRLNNGFKMFLHLTITFKCNLWIIITSNLDPNNPSRNQNNEQGYVIDYHNRSHKDSIIHNLLHNILLIRIQILIHHF